MGFGDLRGWGSVGRTDVMGVLVSWEVDMRTKGFLRSRVVPGETSNLVADETFVVSQVFCLLYQGQIDLVNIHGIGVPRGFLGIGGTW